MIPCTPITEEVRLRKFVEEEWTTILSKIIGNVQGGWKGLLYTSYATINQGDAFGQLLNVPLDGGLSRSWALVSIVNLLFLFLFDL
jgi:endo-1,3(4)-beta-glucanase